MSNAIKFILALTMLSALLLASCSSETSQSEAAKSDDGQAVQEQPVEVAQAEPKNDSGKVTAQPQDTPAGRAYADLLAKTKELEKQATSQQAMMRVVAEIEQLFKGFIVEYPEGQESNDAHFQLGMLYVSLNRHAQGIPYLEHFIDKAGNDTADKVGLHPLLSGRGLQDGRQVQRCAESLPGRAQ